MPNVDSLQDGEEEKKAPKVFQNGQIHGYSDQANSSTVNDVTSPMSQMITPPPNMLPNFLDLLLTCREHAEFFKHDVGERAQRLYSALMEWQNYIVLAESLIQKIDSFAYKYDFDEHTPGNGYRSFITVTNACINYGFSICNALLSARSTMFFRKKYYMKEVEACSQVLCSLCGCLRYLLILNEWSKDSGDLFANGEHSPEELFETGETINQYCFYGRCLGFQYNDSIRNIMRFISISMAGFSEAFYGRDVDNPLMKTTRNVWTSGKYILNPELRARRIVNLSQNAKIEFCKAFWFLAESEIMHRIPSMVGSYIKINQVIEIPAEPLKLPQIINITEHSKEINSNYNENENDWIDIPIPSAHLGTGLPVNVRLLSYRRREGMIGLGSKGFRSWRKLYPRSECLLFHCHGGGFVAQSSKSHELYLRDWAVALDTPILSIDYSLAPEAPYPRAIEEVFYAYCWMLRNAEHLGTTADRVVVMGDSAGANLSIVLTLKCIKNGIRIPDGIFLAYCPTLINFVPSPARLLCLMDPLLPFGFMMRCLRAYAATNPENTKENAKNEELLNTIRKAGDQEPRYKLNLSMKTSNNLLKVNQISPSNSCTSSIAENSNWEQIKTKSNSNPVDIMDIEIGDDILESTINTFASASYHSEILEPTDLPSLGDNSSLISFEDDSQPINHYPNNNLITSSKEKYTTEFVDSYIIDNLSEEVQDDTLRTINTVPTKSQSDEHLLTDVTQETVDSLQARFQQALHSISNTFNRITQSYEIRSDGLTSSQVGDIRNIDALIARSPSSEFGFHVPNDPFLSPYYADDNWLQQMPATKIVTIEMDPCLDDCVMFAKKLKRLNRPVTLDILKGLPHGFLNFTMISSEAMEGSKYCIKCLKELLDLENL